VQFAARLASGASSNANAATAVFQFLRGDAAIPEWLFLLEETTLHGAGNAAHELENCSKTLHPMRIPANILSA
jgi:hypothetical protein